MSLGRICPSFVFHEIEYVHFYIYLYYDLSTELPCLVLVGMGMGYNRPGVAYLSYKHNCDVKNHSLRLILFLVKSLKSLTARIVRVSDLN